MKLNRSRLIASGLAALLCMGTLTARAQSPAPDARPDSRLSRRVLPSADVAPGDAPAELAPAGLERGPLVGQALYPSSEETIFGAEMDFITSEWGMDFLAQTDTTWVRKNGLLWSRVETSEGARNWGYQDFQNQGTIDQQLINAAQRGWKVLLVVRSTPSWAQADSPWTCSFIRDDKLAAFGNFMYDVVARYSNPPYNVKFFEIWNEPDVPRIITVGGQTYTIISNSSDLWPFGCMGDNAGQYYGGEKFAKVLKAVYPRVKAANPEAQVLVGGLLLSATPPTVWYPDNWYANMARFAEGIVRGENFTGGQYFDGISFHSYDYYCHNNAGPGGGLPNNDIGHCSNGWPDTQYSGALYSNRDWNSDSRNLPSVVTAKTRALKDLLARYNITGKYLIASEASLLCERDDGTNNGRCYQTTGQRDAEYEQTKAYFVPRLMAGAIAEGLRGALYYTVRDYCENQNPFGTSLLNCDRTWRPSAYAYKFATQKLHGVKFVREITEYPNVMGYEFERGGRKLWLVWSRDNNDQYLSLPSLPQALWNTTGGLIAPSLNIALGKEPIYIEWSSR